MRTPLLASGFAALLVHTAAIPRVHGDAVVVDACGKRFAGYGYLVGDLDCSGYPSYSVELDGGTLSLSGFRIVGGKYGVLCHRSCTVVNGTIEGAREDGIVAFKNVKAVNLTVRDNGFAGVKAGAAALVERSTLIGNARCGVQGLKRAKLKNVVSRDNDCGAHGDISATVIDSQIFDNARGGVLSERIAATRSVIRDNQSSDQCGVSVPCADLMSSDQGRPPRLKESTCETSLRGGTLFTGETWGVCSLD